MKVTEKILLDNGFDKRYCDITKKDWYEKSVPVKGEPNRPVFLDISNNSNMPDREWYVHVDDDYRCTIGCVDFDTTKQFNTFMGVLDIDFKLTVKVLNAVRKNKRHENRVLDFFENGKKVVKVSRWMGWICYSKDIEKEKHLECREIVMKNLYWLLGNDCDEDTWKNSVEHWKTRGYFMNFDEVNRALDSFKNK